MSGTNHIEIAAVLDMGAQIEVKVGKSRRNPREIVREQRIYPTRMRRRLFREP